MEQQAKILLTFDSQEEAERFLLKFMQCGGEQATGFCVVSDKSDTEQVHLSSFE